MTWCLRATGFLPLGPLHWFQPLTVELGLARGDHITLLILLEDAIGGGDIWDILVATIFLVGIIRGNSSLVEKPR